MTLPGLTDGPAAGGGSTGSLDLIDQTVDADADSPWSARLRVSGPTADASVVATVYEAVADRFDFLAGIESGDLGGPIARLDAVAVGDGTDVVRVILSPEARDNARMEGPAVHPMLISLRDGRGATLDQLTAYVVLAGDDPVISPLAVALVLPFGLDPRISPDGSSLLSRRDEQQLSVVADALAAHRRTPLTVDLTAETLVSLSETGRQSALDLLSDLAAAVSDRELLVRPFVRLQPAGWFQSGLVDEFAGQITAATATTSELLGSTPAGSVWLGDATLDAATVERLDALGMTRFAVPGATARSDLFEIAGVQTTHSATAVDGGLAGHIGSTGDPVLDAHRLLADLAMIAQESAGSPGGTVVLPPPDWAPSDPFLNALIDGLEVSSLVVPTTLSGLFDAQPPAERRVVLDAATPDPLGNYPDRLEEVSREVAGLATVLPETSELAARFETVLLTSGSADLSIFEREAYLTTVSQGVAAVTPVVTAPEGRRVTMTGRTGVIPIGLDNQSGRPVRVVVQLRSDKLEFPDGSAFETELTEGLNELEVPVKARTSGDSTLELAVLSPDRSLELTATSVTVRSTALSGIGLIIAAVALLILLAWWIRNFRSGRRDRRLVAGEADPAEPASVTD